MVGVVRLLTVDEHHEDALVPVDRAADNDVARCDRVRVRREAAVTLISMPPVEGPTSIPWLGSYIWPMSLKGVRSTEEPPLGSMGWAGIWGIWSALLIVGGGLALRLGGFIVTSAARSKAGELFTEQVGTESSGYRARKAS